MGPLLAQLTKMGLENIGYELITDVRRFHSNGERKIFETSGIDDARAFAQAHPTFHVSALNALFEEAGRSKAAANQALTGMVGKGELVRLGSGNYKRTDVKAIEPPKENKRGITPPYEVSNQELILKAMKGRKKISLDGMIEMLISHGRNKKSASPIVSKLAKLKLLKQVGKGLYEVTGKQLPEPKAPKKSATMSSAEKKEADRIRAQAYRDKVKAERQVEQQSQPEGSNG